ncbi:MAG TPA: cyclic nucleotide-binding domain-containing protein [Myxococcota bacterium]|nr:cyclic nucleotide-binding domain-containing protein [Myxococcota bacterium]
MDTPQIRQFLKEIPVFAGLAERPLDKLVELMKERTLAAEAVVFSEGEAARDMYVLVSGQVKVVKRSSRGTLERTLAILKKGDCFGEMALIDVLPRSATVRTLEPATLLSVSIADLYALYKYDTEGYAFLVMNIARELSRRLRRADQIIVDFFVNVDEYLSGAIG